MEDSPNNARPLIAVIAFFLTITSISVLLRLYVRLRILRAFQLDDYFMCAAQLNFILDCAFVCAGVHYGLGRHNDSLSMENQIEGLKYQALATLGYISNMMFIKLSIALFLLRIAVERRYVWILRCSIWVVTIWSIAIFIFDLLQCRPIAAQWDLTIKNAECVSGDDFAKAAYSISVMTIVSDWLYALLPIPMIWSVNMTLQQKITVILILSLGIFASIATIIRLKFIVDLTDVSDVLFTGTQAMVWTIIEPAVAITAASLITIRPLLRSLKIAGFESSERRSGRSTGPRGFSISTRDRRQQTNDLPLRSDVPKTNWTSSVGGGKVPTRVSIQGLSVDREAKGLGAREEDIGIRRTPPESPLTSYRDTGSEEHIMDNVHIKGIGIRRTVEVQFESHSIGRTVK